MMHEMQIHRTPELIAGEINVIKAQAREIYCRSAIEIGRRLTEAKAMLPHGRWLEWLEVNVEYSERTAQELMRMYEEYGRNTNPQAIADLSYTQAVILLGLDRETRTELLESGDVAEKSTRELREEVRRLNEEIEKRQVTIDQLLGDQESAEASVKEAEDRTAEAEKALDEMRTAWNDEKAAAKKAGEDAQAARQRMQDALDRATASDGEVRKLKAELEAERSKPAPLPTVQQVEVVPPEVEAELAALRKKAMAAPNEKVILLRESYRKLVENFREIEGMIAELAASEPETAAKYRNAVSAAARKMADALEAI